MALQDKSTRWQFTAFEEQWVYFNPEVRPDFIAEGGWQMEKSPSTGKLHYQGHLRTNVQVRLSFLIKKFPGVHFEVARDWSALKNYDKKKETRVEGSEPMAWPTDDSTSRVYSSMDNALLVLAENRGDTYSNWQKSLGADVDTAINASQTSEEEVIKQEFWGAVNRIVLKNPQMVQVFARPDVYRVWRWTRQTWIALSEM